MLIESEELIVTQWDVNSYVVSTMLDAYGINSYIVGCKLERSKELWQMKEELIVTQWDVNIITLNLKQEVVKELIVTQWDVNDCKHFSKAKGGKRINSYIVGCK